MPKVLKTVIFEKKISPRGGGSEKGQKNLTYYLNGPLFNIEFCAWIGLPSRPCVRTGIGRAECEPRGRPNAFPHVMLRTAAGPEHCRHGWTGTKMLTLVSALDLLSTSVSINYVTTPMEWGNTKLGQCFK